MIPVQEALQRIRALITTMPVEDVFLRDSTNRILARSVAARRTQPPFAASAMDGYAVRDVDATIGATLRVIGESQAGREIGRASCRERV